MEKASHLRNPPPPQRDHRLGKHNHFVIKAHCFMKTENKVIKANLRNITVIYKLKTTKHGNKRNYL